MRTYQCRLVGTDIADFIDPLEWEEVPISSPKEAVRQLAISYEIENSWTDVCSYIVGEVKVEEYGEEVYRFRINAKDVPKAETEVVDNK